jgi:hypothetical protein
MPHNMVSPNVAPYSGAYGVTLTYHLDDGNVTRSRMRNVDAIALAHALLTQVVENQAAERSGRQAAPRSVGIPPLPTTGNPTGSPARPKGYARRSHPADAAVAEADNTL